MSLLPSASTSEKNSVSNFVSLSVSLLVSIATSTSPAATASRADMATTEPISADFSNMATTSQALRQLSVIGVDIKIRRSV